MPRNVRNFWIEATIDGRQQRIATGPVSKDGGFSLTIYQRSDGDVTTALRVTGHAFANGELSLAVHPVDNHCTNHPVDGERIHVQTYR